MYAWYVCRLNDISWSDTPGIVKIVKGLVAGCDEKESPNDELRQQGFQMWHYTKQLENDCITQGSHSVNLTAEARVNGKEEYEQLQDMLGSAQSSMGIPSLGSSSGGVGKVKQAKCKLEIKDGKTTKDGPADMKKVA